LTAQRKNAGLFGRLYRAHQQRDGDLAQFFSHENQSIPPSLSDYGELRLGQKSALLTCIDFDEQPNPPNKFDSKIFDGSAVVYYLVPKNAKHLLIRPTTLLSLFFVSSWKVRAGFSIDCIWDRYLDGGTKCGISTRT